MHYVIAEFNTNEKNEWVYDECLLQGDPLPMCVFGPFEDYDEAMKYAEDFMPDDTDVYDVYVTSEPPEEGWVINDPKEYPEGYKEEGRDENTDSNEKQLVA